jgi:hypothetical protein
MSNSRTGRVALLAALALVLVFGGIRIFDRVAHTCGDQERAAFLEFPQYGGRVILPGNDIDAGGCVASFQTTDPNEEVIRYYKHQLEQHGWMTQGFQGGAPEGGVRPAGGSLPASVVLSGVPSCAPLSVLCSGTLTATRASFFFNVGFETTEGSTSVVVRVSEASGS